jgi:tubulin--tyrosine ligase
MVGETLTPTYFDVATSTISNHPSSDPSADEYVLVDGTPASCAQLGLHHFFTDRGPVDLVLSGPNYGRNTTAVFALSSGTLGGALEAAVCGVKAIALSYAFFGKDHDFKIIKEASELSVKIVEKLMQDWSKDVDVYSINVPLVQGVETHKVFWTQMLHNQWSSGSCFREASDAEEEAGRPAVSEKKIRKGEVENHTTSGKGRKRFLWAPKFTDVYQSVEAAGPGSDGWAVKEGCTR